MSSSNAELRNLAEGLSELLKRAIASHGELGAEEWERMESLQRQAYILKHPEVAPESALLAGQSKVLEGEAKLEQPDMSDPEIGPPYELVIAGYPLANFVEENFDVTEHQFAAGHRMKLGRLRVTVEVVEDA